MKEVRILLISIMVLSSAFASQAQTPVSGQPPAVKVTATLVRELGKPVQLRISDGRIAEIFLYELPVKSYDFGFTVDRDSCADKALTANFDCSFKSDFLFQYYAFRWISNSTNQGHILRNMTQGGGGGNYDFVGKTAVMSQDRVFYPSFHLAVKPAMISCADYSWLPGGSVKPPNVVQVTAWAPQDQRRNPETQGQENRLVSLFSDVRFQKNPQGSLTMTSGSISFKGYSGIMMPIAFSDFSMTDNLLVQRGDDTCNIHLVGKKNSSTKDVFDAYQFDLEKLTPNDFKPYVYGQSPFIDLELNNKVSSVDGGMGYYIKFPEFIQ